MKELQYSSGSWMVRRWDWFNRRITGPKSFCQFWRTVLLWATLASLPLIGKLFRTVEVPRSSPSLVYHVTRLIWTALWPVRKIVGAVGSAGITVVEYIDARPKLQTVLTKIIGIVMILVGAVGFIMYLGLGIYFLIQTWMNSWQLFLTILGIAVGSIAAAIIAIATSNAWGSMLLGLGKMLWDVALVSKRRICPPITIVRSKR